MKKIEEAAKEFEAMFVTEMLKPMFDGLEPNETFGGGKTEEIFNGFMREEYGKMIAQSGQFGIADQVKQQLIELQSRQNGQGLAQNVHGHNSGKTKGAADETDGA
jgi:flagellar protein FlgJ